jgi:hypothetical protein
MVQRRPGDAPTIEEEALEFDGTHADQLDDTYRFRIVAASESANGKIGFDDRGQPQWKWASEIGAASTEYTGTFDQLKALENPALSLAEAAPPPAEPPRKVGYDPYATGVFEKPKGRR